MIIELGTIKLIIYLLLIVLLIVLIILGVKVIGILNKVDKMVDDVQEKISSLDKLFNVVNFATEKMSMATEVIIGTLTTGFKKLFNSNRKHKKNKKLKEEEDINE